MTEIIDDIITKNRKFREERLKRLNRLKELNAPKEIINHEEYIARMTLDEYIAWCERTERAEMEEQNRRKKEYAKNNQIQKTIVDEIYNRVEKLEYDSFAYMSRTSFYMILEPVEIMGYDDFMNDLYETFLNHARELYQKKYVREHEEYEKVRDGR